MKTSKFLSLGKSDFLKATIMLALSAIVTALIPTLESGTLPTIAQLKAAGIVGLTAGLTYLLKNVLTNSQDQFLKKES